MKKSYCFLALVLIFMFLAGSGYAATPAKDTVIIATSTEPVRFFSCGPEGSNQNDTIVLNNIYDPLVRMTAEGKLVPCLAKEWKVSEDGLVYTFYLRDDVTFHNGAKLTAADVAYTFDICHPTTTGKALIINYDHSEVVDDHTVKIHLTAPFAAFLNGVASRAGYIINKEYMEKEGVQKYLSAPIGTGPYKFVSRISGDTVTMEANDKYWNGAPSIKKILVKTMSDATTQVIALEAGDIDVILAPAISNMLKLDKKSDATWSYCDAAARVTLHFCVNKGYPGADLNFRKAVQYAINKQDIVDGVMEGYAKIADIDMVPTYTGRPDKYLKVERDPVKAKEYLAKSSYKNEPFDLLVQSGTKMESVAQIIQAQLLDMGINCTITATDTATFTSLWYGATYGAMIRSTTSSLQDADCLASFFLEGQAQFEKNLFPRFAELNRLVKDGRTAQGDAARKEIYEKAVDIITEEAYMVPLYYDVNAVAYNKNLKGIVPHPLNMLTVADWNW